MVWKLTFRRSVLIYAALFFALIHPFWMFGEVVAPYRFRAQAGPPDTRSGYVENGKFFDYWHVFIPEMQAHLQAPRSGWLALWTNDNELGRPLYQGGFSGAYFPLWVVSKAIGEPVRLLTLLSLSFCFFAGLFLILLCRELALKPIAGLVAGASVAASPLMMYWLSSPMFPATFCWSAGVLYALARLARRADFAGGAVLAFSCYSLMVTGYPQAVVHMAYILTGYCLWTANRCRKSAGTGSAVKYLAAVAVSGVTGVLFSLPGLFDIADTASRSSRVAPDVSFFTFGLPQFDSITALMRVFSVGLFPEIIANPMSPSFPLSYDGLSVTPTIIFLALFSLLRCLRQTWGWWLAVVLACAFAFVPPLYAFGVQHLGFGISHSNPLEKIILPLAIISAYAVSGLTELSPWRAPAIALASLGAVLSLAAVLCFFWMQSLEIRWPVALAALSVILLLASTAYFRSSYALIAALVVTGCYVSFPLILRQPLAGLVQNSALSARVSEATPAGARLAFVAPGADALLPNSNALFKISSIHSYDSLSPRQYQSLVRELGGETEEYGRFNRMIAPDFGSQQFWMSNIGLVISPAALVEPNLENIGQEGQLHLYHVVDRMGCCLQSPMPMNGGPDEITLATRDGIRPVKTMDQGDAIELEVRSLQSHSVLTLSQQYHHYWRASVRTASGWEAARPVRVNGVFQGVAIPAGSDAVRLQFMPFVRLAWFGHVFWLLVGLLGMLRLCIGGSRRVSKFKATLNR